MNMTYKAYPYPLNLLLDVCGTKNVPDHSGSEFQAVLNEVLNTLPEKKRKALTLRYELQLTFREIGIQMGCSEAWANKVVSKGLCLLKHPARYRRIQGGRVQPAPKNSTPATKLPISGMGLNVNPYNCLLRHGLGTAEDVLELTPEELMSIRNMGRKSYVEVVERLAAFGYDVSAYIDESTGEIFYDSKRKYNL